MVIEAGQLTALTPPVPRMARSTTAAATATVLRNMFTPVCEKNMKIWICP
jgi:hypothetical protein